MPKRAERSFRGGTRVRIDAPGYSFHGETGTVAQDMTGPERVCFVLRDRGGRERRHICTLGSEELARIRDQRPNPQHAGDFSDGWWILA
jgi:hypothetical protein